jgi:hypothetical protein
VENYDFQISKWEEAKTASEKNQELEIYGLFNWKKRSGLLKIKLDL